MWNTKNLPEYLKKLLENGDDFTRHTNDFYEYLKKEKKKLYRDKSAESNVVKAQIDRVLGAVRQLDCDYRLFKWRSTNENHSRNKASTACP